jgi:O-antigen/teichoic acid export membrane protein
MFMRVPLRNLSANVAQQIINQFFGLVIFYVLSRNMDKSGFGELNWCLAFLLIAFSILSFGLDQLTVKKIASGEKPAHAVGIFSLHVLIAGGLFYAGLIIIYFFYPHMPMLLMLLALGAGKLMIFLSLPFKQAAMGLEKFTSYALMSIISNVVRGVALIICGMLHVLDVRLVIVIFIIGDATEYIATILLYRYRIKMHFQFKSLTFNYFGELKEASPQIGVILATAAIARFDWLFIGVFASAASLAEYSFTYKAYEMSTLPLLVIGPLLVPRFVKYFQKRNEMAFVYSILRIEMIICSLIMVVVNILWTPVIDMITKGRYGAVNSKVVFLLTLCTPFLYINNILWTIAFAKGQLKGIFKIIFTACCVNIIADILLIPFMGNIGAALACLLSLVVQMLLYCRLEKSVSFGSIGYAAIVYPLLAVIAIGSASVFAEYIGMALFMGIAVFFTMVLLVNKFIRQDISSGLELLSSNV